VALSRFGTPASWYGRSEGSPPGPLDVDGRQRAEHRAGGIDEDECHGSAHAQDRNRCPAFCGDILWIP
jgi:hypothetical protein